MNSQILIYKLKKSGWLSNQILSLELAVGLSHQTNRVLFLYDEDLSTSISPINAVRFGNGFTLEKDNWFKVINNLPEYKPSTILDLYDNLPVELITKHQLKESINSKPTKAYSKRSAGISSCFVEDLDNVDEIDLKYFSEGRNIIVNPAANIWNFNHPHNFGYYSRFFYNKNIKLKYCFENLKMLSWIENLSNNISSKLNNYNACHIRLTDLLKMLPQEKKYNQIVTDVICNVVDNQLPLIISSDEPSSSDFFIPLKNKFKNIIFLRDFCQNECQELWQSIPWINECIVGLVYQNVLSNAKIFLGTPGSTFSGIVHRKWCIKNQIKKLYFIHSGIPGSKCEVNNYFSNGLFVDKKDGPYSWNKITSKHIHNLSWYREWIECIL